MPSYNRTLLPQLLHVIGCLPSRSGRTFFGIKPALLHSYHISLSTEPSSKTMQKITMHFILISLPFAPLQPLAAPAPGAHLESREVVLPAPTPSGCQCRISTLNPNASTNLAGKRLRSSFSASAPSAPKDNFSGVCVCVFSYIGGPCSLSYIRPKDVRNQRRHCFCPLRRKAMSDIYVTIHVSSCSQYLRVTATRFHYTL